MQWERRDNDPLMTISGIRVCTACAMLQAFALVRDAAPHVTCPILAVHGERDEVCRLDAVKTLLDTQVRCRQSDASLPPPTLRSKLAWPMLTSHIQRTLVQCAQHSRPKPCRAWFTSSSRNIAGGACGEVSVIRWACAAGGVKRQNAQNVARCGARDAPRPRAG